MGTWRGVMALSLLVLPLAGCGPDEGQVQACLELLPAFEDHPEGLEDFAVAVERPEPVVLRLNYRRPEENRRRWLSCAFAGAGFGAGRLEVVAVATDRTGRLSEVKFALLRVWARLRTAPLSQESPPAAGAPPERMGARLYLLQTLVNALAGSAIYSLLAVGYSLVYGVVGRINLAFGSLSMLGAIQGASLVTLFLLAGSGTTPAMLAATLLAVAGLGALQGRELERRVFRPLAARPGQAPLIAALGVAIAAEEGVRLLQGARDRWLPPLFEGRVRLAGDADGAVFLHTGQVLIAAIAGLSFAAILLLIRRSRFGLGFRAVCDHPGMAALVGVDVDGIRARAFMLGGGCAAVAGLIELLYYGGANAFMGWLIGFKALTAAVAGGLGSVEGAMLGGLLVGLFETLWSAYLPLAERDIAIFGLLALTLLFRPQGLLGRVKP